MNTGIKFPKKMLKCPSILSEDIISGVNIVCTVLHEQ